MVETKLQFILFYTLFIFFVVTISAYAGYDIILETQDLASIPETGINLLNPLQTFGIFFALLSVSTEYVLLGALLIVPYSIAVVYVILEFARGI